jgi:PAS domain S-box-containing protein
VVEIASHARFCVRGFFFAPVQRMIAGEIEERLRLLSSNIPDTMIYQLLITPDGCRKFLYISPSVENLHKISVEDALKDSGLLYRQVIDEDRVKLMAAENRALADMTTFRIEVRYFRSPGEMRWLALMSGPRRQQDGSVLWDGIATDITERKEAEEKVRQSEIGLQAAVELRDEFISIASHELKTPVTALRLQLELLSQLCGAGSSGHEQKISEISKKAFVTVLALNELLDELLDVTRIRSGKFKLQKKKMDLRANVVEHVGIVQEAINQTGVTIVVNADRPVIGEWDATRINQVISNLLSNATKYGEGKSIEISVTSEKNSGMALLSVTDHGIGIRKEEQAKIFERFQRVASGSRVKGLGLGLYVVKQIVEAHKGSISVESEPGKGSTFVVRLPVD